MVSGIILTIMFVAMEADLDTMMLFSNVQLFIPLFVLSVAMAMIIPQFKHGSFAIISKNMYKLSLTAKGGMIG